MEGVVILSNNKPLLSTRFSNPRLANLAIDAFLNAKRTKKSRSTTTGVRTPSYDTYGNGKGRDDSLEPIIWFDTFEDLSSASRHAAGVYGAASSSNGRKGKARPRLNSYTMSDDDDDEETDSDDDEESSDEEDEEATGNAWASSSKTKTDESINDLPATSKTGTSYGCCHISHNNLQLLVPVRQSCDPSIPFSYLYSLIGVLRQYVGGDVNDVTIKENFDITLQLLEETFSAPYPVSTDASALQELVPTSSLFSKMLMAGLAAAAQATSSVSSGGSNSQLGGGGMMGGLGASGNMTPSSLFSSPLYWRRSGIKYAQNEIYFDINEEIKAVIDKNGIVIAGDIWGRIDCRSKLSGMPDVSLSLSNANVVEDPSFHPCVRIGKWTASQSLSFVPPDGEFELMGYRLSTSSPGSLYGKASASGRSSDTLPIRIRPIITTGEVGGSFNISLAPSGHVGPGGVALLEDVMLHFYLGASATTVKASIQSNDNRRLGTMSSSGSTGSSVNKPPAGGAWEFDSISHTLIWRISKLVSSPVLSGTWQYDDNWGKSKPSPVLSVRFKAPLTNVSGLSITSLKVTGERYSMYKGLRSNMKGHVEVRW